MITLIRRILHRNRTTIADEVAYYKSLAAYYMEG